MSGDEGRQFSIDAVTASLRTASSLDREMKSSYLLSVQAAQGNPVNFDQTQVS